MRGRLCFVITGLGLGGAETQLVRLAIGLTERGWDVSIVSMLPINAFAGETQAHGIPVHSLGCRRGVPDPRALLRLRRRLRESPPDVVHSFMVHANLLARVSRLLYWTPVQISSARSVNEGSYLRMLAYRITDPLCDLTTQVSLPGLRRYVEIGAVPAHKGVYIPNGVDTAVFCPNAQSRARMRRELRIGDEFVWLAVGRCEAVKNYPLMLRAFAQVGGKRPSALLIIAGGGRCQPELESFAAGLQLRDSVRFLGACSGIPALMNAADGYVLTSACEGIPNSLLEALASGIPSVATAVGGIPDVLRDGRTGILIRSDRESEVSEALLKMMALSAGERANLGRDARQDMCRRFALPVVTEIWERIYLAMMESARERTKPPNPASAIRPICQRLESPADESMNMSESGENIGAFH